MILINQKYAWSAGAVFSRVAWYCREYGYSRAYLTYSANGRPWPLESLYSGGPSVLT